MHLDCISHGLQRDGAQVLHAIDKETILLADNFTGHTQHCPGALVEAFDKPCGLGVAASEENLEDPVIPRPVPAIYKA